MKETIKQGTVIEKKIPQILIYGENTVSVWNIDEFKRHRGSAVHRVFVATSRAKSAMTAKRNAL